MRAATLGEAVVNANLILPLLRLVQGVERDAKDGFQPVHGSDAEAVARADAALVLLTRLHTLAAARLAREGWAPLRSGDSAGSTLYRHTTTGEESESPSLVLASWQGEVLQSLMLIITPAVHRRQTMWAVRVVECSAARHTTNQDQDRYSAARATANQDQDVAARHTTSQDQDVCVIDVCATDSDGTVTTLRDLIVGPWRGFPHRVQARLDPASPMGRSLESWGDTTLCGLAMLATAAKQDAHVLILGFGGGLLPAFLLQHSNTLRITVVEVPLSHHNRYSLTPLSLLSNTISVALQHHNRYSLTP
jgi:hypothetical protein